MAKEVDFRGVFRLMACLGITLQNASGECTKNDIPIENLGSVPLKIQEISTLQTSQPRSDEFQICRLHVFAEEGILDEVLPLG